MNGFPLLREQLHQVITALVGCRGREHEHVAPVGFVHLHGIHQLDPAPLRYLGRADRASPDAAAGLQPCIAGRAVLFGLPDLDV